jgi:fermentation-respiration switch protein FrsA (DUF1100 family)
MKRLVTAGVTGLLLAMASIPGLRTLSRVMMYPGDAAPLPPPPVLARLGLRSLDATTSDGLRLRIALVPPAGPDEPLILYFHGNAEAAARNLDLAGDLAQRGWGVALAEYRGYGGMPGSPTEEGLFADGEAAMEALATQGLASSRPVLVGRSLGTGVAVEMALRGHGRALVLIGPPTSMVDMGRLMVGPLARWAVADRFDSSAKAPRVRLPTLIVHGTQDDVVPFWMGAALADRFPHVRLLPLAGVGHNDIPDLAGLLAHEIPALLATPR